MGATRVGAANPRAVLVYQLRESEEGWLYDQPIETRAIAACVEDGFSGIRMTFVACLPSRQQVES